MRNKRKAGQSGEASKQKAEKLEKQGKAGKSRKAEKQRGKETEKQKSRKSKTQRSREKQGKQGKAWKSREKQGKAGKSWKAEKLGSRILKRKTKREKKIAIQKISQKSISNPWVITISICLLFDDLFVQGHLGRALGRRPALSAWALGRSMRKPWIYKPRTNYGKTLSDNVRYGLFANFCPNEFSNSQIWGYQLAKKLSKS